MPLRTVGSQAATGAVQLYVRDEAASVALPVKRLRGFSRAQLQPGEQRTLQWQLGAEAFELLDRTLTPVVEPGKFTIEIAASASDVRQCVEVTIPE